MSDHSITSLIEKLEGAEVGSRELDADVALQVGWTVHPGDNWIGPHAEIAVPDYTTSLDAALALAERVLPGWHIGVQPWFHTDPDRVMSRAYLIRPDWKRWNPTGDEWCDQHHGKSCHTAALAVVSALLRAQSEAR